MVIISPGKNKYKTEKLFERSIEIRCSHIKTNDEYIYLKLTDSHYKGHMEFSIRSKNDLKQILRLIGIK